MSESDTTTPVDPATAPPVADPAPDPAPAPARRGGGLLMVLGGAVAAILGYGAAQVVPDGWPLPDTGALTAAQADLAQRLTAAETALAASEARVAELTSALDTVAQNVANLPAAPAAPAPPDLTPLQDRLAALEGQLQGIASLPAGDGPANAALASQIAALQAQVRQLAEAPPPAPAAPVADTGAITAALAEAEAGAAALRRAGAMDLVAAALQTGAPYGDALAALGGDVPADLAGPAITGVATDAALLAAFPDAARAALAAVAAEEAQAGGWSDRALAFLQMQTGARSVTEREGTGPDAVLSRAEAALREGRLADAVAEVTTLPPAAQAPLADWLAQAGTTLAARAALAGLQGG
jgi:hypothetical protein